MDINLFLLLSPVGRDDNVEEYVRRHNNLKHSEIIMHIIIENIHIGGGKYMQIYI